MPARKHAGEARIIIPHRTNALRDANEADLAGIRLRMPD